MAAFVQDSREHEQAASGNSVGQHDEHGAVESRGGEAENSEHDEAEVADRRVGDQLLHVGLNHGDERAVNDADQRQRHNPPLIVAGLFGKQAEVEAQQAVGAHLQQHSGQQDRAGGGRFDVRVGQPGVEREQRNFHREGEEEAEEEPLRGGGEGRHLALGDQIANFVELEGASVRVEPQYRSQHEHRGDHGVHEKLYGGVNLALVAEDANQQGHGDQRGFPEEIEEEEVERSEDADQRSLHNKKEDKEFLHAIVNRLPRDQHAQRSQERGQHHQPHGDAVHGHVVVDVGSGNPLLVNFVLEASLAAMEVHREMQREKKSEQRNNESEDANVAITPGKQHEQQRAQQRGEDDERQDVRAPAIGRHRSAHSHPNHVGNHDGRTGGNPSSVRAEIAGLHVPGLVGNDARAVGGVVDRVVDDLAVDSLPQNTGRAVNQRLHE